MKELSNLRQNYNQTFGFSVSDDISLKPRKGLDEQMVRQISALKNEPEWMLDFRLKAYNFFVQKPLPQWGVDLLRQRYSAHRWRDRSAPLRVPCRRTRPGATTDPGDAAPRHRMHVGSTTASHTPSRPGLRVRFRVR